MNYTKTEAARIDTLLNIFHDYSATHTYFDIAYSAKCGYVFLDLSENGTVLDETVIQDSEALLSLLFDQAANDVRDERVSNGDDTEGLYQTEIAALRAILAPTIDTMGEGKEHCLRALEEYIYQNSQG